MYPSNIKTQFHSFACGLTVFLAVFTEDCLFPTVFFGHFSCQVKAAMWIFFLDFLFWPLLDMSVCTVLFCLGYCRL